MSTFVASTCPNQKTSPAPCDEELRYARSRLTEEKIGPRDGAGKTVVVAMSGGVDSAVTALLMRERGYRVVGMNLRLFSPDDEDHRANPCCGIPAMDDARATCATLGVPFYAVNMELEFAESVIHKFVDEYASGRTPNPCLECNRHVKFRHLVQRAKQLGADCLATGHYVQVERDGANPDAPARLLRAVDGGKDQSYVLYTLSQEHLRFLQFPLGRLTKPEVRAIARSFGLPVADKAESQEICFVGNRSYADFVAERRPDLTGPGPIVTDAGEVLGEHRGLVRHTVGQRRGLGLTTNTRPYFVLRLDTSANQLVVGSRDEARVLALELTDVSMTSGSWPSVGFSSDIVVRYRGRPMTGSVAPGPETTRTAIVHFGPEGGPVASPGQAVVFYHGDEVLGGGTIQRTTQRAPAPVPA